MKKKIIVALALLALSTTLLIGCTKSAPRPSPSSSPPVTPPVITATGTSPSPTHSPVPLPAQNNPDTMPVVFQEGLPLTVTEPADASTIAAETVTVKGTTKPGAIVSVNDEVDTADGNGNFSVSVPLEDGLNAIDVIASDDNGNQGEVLLMVDADLSQIPDSQMLPASAELSQEEFQNPFLLIVTQPVDGATLNTDTVNVKGQTVPEATIIINDEVDTADANGNFNISVVLDPGPIAIDVIAINDNGDQSEVMVLVNVMAN
jgi:hypothetical protein